VLVQAGAGGSEVVRLIDLYASTPISGARELSGSSPLAEALYVIDLEVESGAVLEAGNTEDINIYYTGTLTNNGNIYKSDGTTAYTPIELTPTLYGNFDADQAGGNDTDDVNRFNAAFPSKVGDEEYDPLVDWNCDGFIDCLDRGQYIANWSPTGIEDNSCE